MSARCETYCRIGYARATPASRATSSSSAARPVSRGGGPARTGSGRPAGGLLAERLQPGRGGEPVPDPAQSAPRTQRSGPAHGPGPGTGRPRCLRLPYQSFGCGAFGGARRCGAPRSVSPEAREGAAAGVDRGVVQDLLDAQQLVVLGDALGAGRGAGLDLAAVGGDGQVGDGDVLGLAGAVRHHALVAVALGQLDGVQGLGQRADLVDLDEQRVGGAARRCRAASRSGLVTKRSSPTIWTLSPSCR